MIRGFVIAAVVCLVMIVAQANAAPQMPIGASQDLVKKIDQVLSNQNKIMSSLEEMREELRIVKIRATMK